MKKILLVTRATKSNRYSIEKVFKVVSAELSTKHKFTTISIPHPKADLLSIIRNILFLYRYRNKFDLFHITGDCHYAVIPFCCKNVVLTIHDIRLFYDYKGVKKWLYKLIWLTVPILVATKVHFISSQIEKEVCLVFPRTRLNNTVVIHNPVTIKTGISTKKPEYDLLFVGTKSNKQVGEFIQSLKQPYKIIIIGSRISIQANPGCLIKIIEDIDDTELVKIYNKTKVCVLASNYEGFGLVGLEAQLLSTPVFARNIPVFKEIYKNSVVYFEDEADPNLENKLRGLLENKDLRNSKTQEGQLNIKDFSVFETAKRYEELLYN